MNWVFTWNNPDYNAEQPNVWPFVRYAIWQHEVGESGTPHYQGYVQFTKLMSLAQVREVQPDIGYWAPRGKHSSHKAAKAYASKEESRTDGPFEFGTETHQGVDGKLLPLMKAVKDKVPEKDVVDIDPVTWARYYNAPRATASSSRRTAMGSPCTLRCTGAARGSARAAESGSRPALTPTR